MQTMKIKPSAEAGFTLVELAIVLVIIGLIIGGVLVGQDLIKAAEIRATVGQMESTNAAVNTFHGKFGGVPGDLTNTRALQFGLTARTGANARGDGDGTVEGYDGTAVTNAAALGSENALFWVDLSSADLIGEGFSTATDAAAVSLTATTLPNYIPATKLRESTYITVFPSQGRNFFYIDGITATAASTGVITSSGIGLTPTEALSIDEKLDDGLPTTGSVIAANALAATALGYAVETPNTAGSGVCVVSTVNTYNLVEAFAAVPSCGLIARTSF